MARRKDHSIKHHLPDGACSTGSTGERNLDGELARLGDLDYEGLLQRWRLLLGGSPPHLLPRWLLERVLAYRLQAQTLGDLDFELVRMLERLADNIGEQQITGDEDAPTSSAVPSLSTLGLKTLGAGALKPGSVLVREHGGQLHHVMVLEQGFSWNGATYSSLSQLAYAMTGTRWNGHRFFGLDRQSGSTLQPKPLRTQVAAKRLGRSKTPKDGSILMGAQP